MGCPQGRLLKEMWHELPFSYKKIMNTLHSHPALDIVSNESVNNEQGFLLYGQYADQASEWTPLILH